MNKETRTMKFTLVDRINLLSILPVEGDILKLRVVRDLQEQLSLTPQEVASYQVEYTQNVGYKWNKQGSAAQLTVELTPNTVTVICDQLQELNKKKALRVNLIELYERFVENKVLPVEASPKK